MKNKKTILVTGASSGIGREVALQIASKGYNVILTGRNQDKLHDTLSAIDSSQVIYHESLDMNDDQLLSNFVNNIPHKIDGVVFCAGIAEYTPIRALSKSRLQRLMDTNFLSPAQLTTSLLQKKKLNQGSSLVYISSLSIKQGVMATSAYAASKAALSSFAKVAACELASMNIRVNTLCPGIVETPMGDMVTSMSDEVEREYPLGIGMPIDVAEACLFFLSDASRWITGSELIMDGGLTLK